MSTIFRRRASSTSCFFCQSTVLASGPRFNPSFFQCPHCGCWNRYDARGEILSDEPAMHDERLNAASFARRASPNSNHLPSVYNARSNANRSLFCHSCQTNQTLLVNLLSNYLPSPEDPTYAARLASLPAYTQSLQQRYPPVCDSCKPAVEEEIHRKETMARTRALGGALKESRSAGRVRKEERANQQKLNRRMVIWKLQGMFWLGCLAFSLAVNGAGYVGYTFSIWRYPFLPILPVYLFVSLWASTWDPTLSLVQRSKRRGRPMRVEGQRSFMKLQLCAWSSRWLTCTLLVCSSWNGISTRSNQVCTMTQHANAKCWHLSLLLLEVVALIASCLLIQIRQPAPVRLIDTSATRALSRESSVAWSQASTSPVPSSQPTLSSPPPPTTTTTSEPDLFATLSLSNNPVITNYAANPMFGVPSLLAPKHDHHQQSNLGGASQAVVMNYDTEEDNDEDNDDGGGSIKPRLSTTRNRDPNAMDWEPASPASANTRNSTSPPTHERKPYHSETIHIRPPRFAPEQPTGLETLLMRTRLVDSDDDAKKGSTGASGGQGGSGGRHLRRTAGAEWNWCWVYTISTVPVVGLVLALWAGYGYPLRYLG